MVAAFCGVGPLLSAERARGEADFWEVAAFLLLGLLPLPGREADLFRPLAA